MKIKLNFIVLIFFFAWVYCYQTAIAANSNNDPKDKPEKRIVALGGDITEIIFALGAEKHLVGIDTTSLWPEATQSLPKVGYFRALSAEGLLSLSPDLLLMSEAAGPATVIKQIQSVGVSTIKIATAKTGLGVMEKVRAVAQVLALPDLGERLVQSIQVDFSQIKNQQKHWLNLPRVLFLFSVNKGAALASGRDTAADAMIKLAGGVNVFTEYSGYKPVNSEALIAAAPEFILLTENTLKSMGGLNKVMNIPGLPYTPAANKQQIIVMDTLYLLGFGPRTGKAVLELSKHLHPEPGDGI